MSSEFLREIRGSACCVTWDLIREWFLTRGAGKCLLVESETRTNSRDYEVGNKISGVVAGI
jgi:hypothetical protein